MKRLLIIVIFLFVGSSLKAQWILDLPTYNSLALGPEEEFDPEFTFDADGNTYYCWTDFRSGDGDLYAQKLDIDGVSQWGRNGLKVGSVISGKNFVLNAKGLTVTPEGGLIVTWYQVEDPSRPNFKTIVTQEIKPNGDLLFDTPQVLQEGHYNEDVTKAVIINGIKANGGRVYIYNFFVQGTGRDNLAIRDDTGVYYAFITNVQGSKAFFDEKNQEVIGLRANDDHTLTAQKYDLNGNEVGFAKQVYSNPFSGSSRIDYATFKDDHIFLGRTLTSDDGQRKKIIVQKLDRNFTEKWPNARFGSNDAYDVQLYPNQDGGATMAWIEPTNNTEPMQALRIASNGTVLWQKPVFNALPGVTYLTPNKFASNFLSGCYVMWFTAKSTGFDLTVQHLDENGQMQFGEQGLKLTNFKWYGSFRLVPQPKGGVVALYSGSQNTDINAKAFDLYTTYFSPQGAFAPDGQIEFSGIKPIYCIGDTLRFNSPEADLDAIFDKTSTLTFVSFGDEYTFVIPEDFQEGNYIFRLQKPNGIRSEGVPIEIKSLQPPTLTSSASKICGGTDIAVELSGSCNSGLFSWVDIGNDNPQFVSPQDTRIYTGLCETDGCEPLSTDIEIEVQKPEILINVASSYLAGQNVSIDASGAVSYQWEGENGLLSSTATLEFQPIQLSDAGSYTVSGTDEDGCLGSETFSVFVLSPLSSSNEPAVSFYPNPSSSFLNIDLGSSQKNITVYSVNGTQWHLNYNSKRLDIRKLPAGMYVIKDSSYGGSQVKFVKQ